MHDMFRLHIAGIPLSKSMLTAEGGIAIVFLIQGEVFVVQDDDDNLIHRASGLNKNVYIHNGSSHWTLLVIVKDKSFHLVGLNIMHKITNHCL